MTIPDELPRVLRSLEEAGFLYVLTGSLASVTWGRPRATYDADVVIDLEARDVDKLASAFRQPEWYFDRDAALAAIRSGSEFNILHGATGTKVDFWMKRKTPTDTLRFARRRREIVANVECWVLSPEDTILAKLEWIKLSASERQQSDVAGIIAVQEDRLDWDYLREWAERLGVKDLLSQTSGR
jgi:hypothetical protein